MCSPTPQLSLRGDATGPEDPEQHERIGVYRSAKYDASSPRLRAMPAISACPMRVAASMYSRTVSRKLGISPGRGCGHAAACARRPSDGRRQLGAEVEAFFLIRFAPRQFVADGEVAAPGAPAARHADGQLLLERQREEGVALRLEAGQERLRHAMAADVEEPAVAACVRIAWGSARRLEFEPRNGPASTTTMSEEGVTSSIFSRPL